MFDRRLDSVERRTILRHALVAGVLSLALSLWAMWLGNATNNDGVLYLLTAEAWLTGGWDAARACYAWPFYSIAIAELSRIGLSFEQSAWVINSASMAVLAMGFVVAAGRLSAKVWCLRFAILLILSLPALNLLRSEIVRDIPFLALFIWYVERALAYVNAPSWRRLLQATLLLIAAFLFRLEAAVFLVALPLHALISAWSHHRHHLLRFIVPIVLVGVVMLTGLLVLVSQSADTRLADFLRYKDQLQFVGQSFTQRAELLAKAVLHPVVQNYDQEALAAILATVFIGKWLKTVSWLHMLVAIGYRRRIALDSAPAAFAFSRTLMILALVPPFALLLVSGISTARYYLPAALLFLLLCPMAYAALLERWPRMQRLLLAGLVILVLVGNEASFSANTRVVRDAGVWLKQQSGSVWCNDRALCYYSGRHDINRDRNYPWRDWQQRWLTEIKGNNWAAIELTRRELTQRERLVAEIGLEPFKEFAGSDGSRVLIFKLAVDDKQ